MHENAHTLACMHARLRSTFALVLELTFDVDQTQERERIPMGHKDFKHTHTSSSKQSEMGAIIKRAVCVCVL